VKFTDTQLQKCYENNFAEAKDSSDVLRQIHALMAARDLFHMLDGPHSLRVHEAIEHLLLPELRPGLRQWYRRRGTDLDATTAEFKDQLSQLTGESFGTPEETLDNPT